MGTAEQQSVDDPFAVRTLSIACPAYNEAAGLEAIVRHWVDYLRSRAHLTQFEIVVCNDGSLDATGAILDRLAAEFAEVKPVHSAQNRGAGAALQRAIRHTRLEWVLLLDADGQIPIECFDPLVAAVQAHQTACATGVRKKQDTAFARFGSWSSGVVANWLHGTHYRDFNSVCKFGRGDLMRSLRLEAGGLSGSTDLTSKLIERKVAMVEVDIPHLPRATGKSSLKRVRDSVHRLLFVLYTGVRQFLFRVGVLRADTE